jgi:hypothetical protein
MTKKDTFEVCGCLQTQKGLYFRCVSNVKVPFMLYSFVFFYETIIYSSPKKRLSCHPERMLISPAFRPQGKSSSPRKIFSSPPGFLCPERLELLKD